MASVFVLALVFAVIYPSFALDSGGCSATDASCEEESSVLLQMSRQQQLRSNNLTDPSDQLSSSSAQSSCWRGKMTPTQYKKCMASVPMNPGMRDCTLAALATSLRDLYSSTGLYYDSLNNSAQLAKGYDFKVHDVKLSAYMEGLWPRLVREKSAGTFALDLATLSYKLKDRHAAIEPELWKHIKSVPPMTVRAELQDGETVFRVEGAAGNLTDSVGKVIQTVNGQSATKYFIEVAFNKGLGVKDAGVAINEYLWDQSIRGGVLPPQDGQMNVVLKDGSWFNSSWVVHFGFEGLCSEEDVIQNSRCLWEKNHNAVLVPKLTENRVFEEVALALWRHGWDVPCGPVPGSATIGDVVPSVISETLVSLFEKGASDAVVEEASESVRPVDEKIDLQRHRTGELHDVTVESFPDAACYAVKVQDKIKGTNICSLKISEFVREGLGVLQKCAVAAVNLAEKYCDGDLLLDVLGNSGGDAVSGHWLNYFLYSYHSSKPFKRPVDVCEWHQYPKNTFLNQMIDIARTGLPQLCEQSNTFNFIEGVEKRMRNVVENFGGPTSKMYGLSSSAVQGWNKSAECLGDLLRSDGPSIPQKNRRGKVGKAFLAFETKYEKCLNASGGVNLSLSPLDASNIYPDPLTPDPLDLEFYSQTVSQVRGGVERNFTTLTYNIPDCPWHPANSMSKDFAAGGKFYSPPTRAINNVRVLSDGTCGSTCSVAVSQQYLLGLATVITYGGLAGKPMDISSYHAGSPNEPNWEDESGLWQSALKSFLDKSIWYPDTMPTAWPFIPLGMSRVLFPQRSQMAKALGPDALPREWYLLPSQYRLDYWTLSKLNRNPEHYLENDPVSLHELIHLYKEANSKLPKPFEPSV